MGYTPEQVDKMSPWKFMAAVEGWNRYHGDNKPQPPTEDEFEEAMRQRRRQLETIH